MTNSQAIIALSQQARSYLLSCDKAITDELIDSNLLRWQVKQRQRKTSAYLFEMMLRHAVNTEIKNHPLGIWLPLTDTSQTNEETNASNVYLRHLLASVLFNFDPHKVVETFKGDHKKVLQHILQQYLHILSDPPKWNKKTCQAWKKYAQTICSAAAFLVDDQQYKTFKSLLSHANIKDVDTLLPPVQLLKKNIKGMNFALACDFIKELGYRDYVMPDRYLIETCLATSLIDIKQIRKAAHKTKILHKPPKKKNAKRSYDASNISTSKFFKAIVTLCRDNGIIPYEFDKLIWLVVSGLFIQPDDKVVKYPVRHHPFKPMA